MLSMVNVDLLSNLDKEMFIYGKEVVQDFMNEVAIYQIFHNQKVIKAMYQDLRVSSLEYLNTKLCNKWSILSIFQKFFNMSYEDEYTNALSTILSNAKDQYIEYDNIVAIASSLKEGGYIEISLPIEDNFQLMLDTEHSCLTLISTHAVNHEL